MEQEHVLTVIAEDRPGLVETLAEVVANHDGNWVDSEMARLGGEFAGILLVTTPSERSEEFRSALDRLSEDGISVTLRDAVQTAAPTGEKARLSVIGRDHPGIVLEVTHVLAERGANVDHLHTTVFTASMSGDPMFSAQIDVTLPDGLSADAISGALEEIAGDIMVEAEVGKIDD